MGWKSFTRSISRPFESIGRAVEDAAKDTYNVTVNAPAKVAGAVTGSDKVERTLSLPTWDELSKPGEAFYNDFNEAAGVLPPSWREYAAPAAATALNFVPGVGPLLSAGFTTAYNAGGMQANQKGMDWGSVGKDALKNFGTAAVQMGVNSALNSAKASQNFKASDAGMRAGFDATQPNLDWKAAATQKATTGSSALGGFNSTATSAAIPAGAGVVNYGTGTTPTGYSGTTTIPGMEGAVPMSSGATMPEGAKVAGELSSLPSNVYKPTFGDMAYTAGVKGAGELGSQALAATLAPEQATALSGFDAGGTDYGTGDLTQGYKFGDVLGAFGEDYKANPSGGRIGATELEEMTKRIGANNWLQRTDARDMAIPAGQYEPEPNTPYSSRLGQIEQGTNKSYQDLLREVDNYNAYYGILDANPTLQQTEYDKWIGDNSLAPENIRPYLQGIQPMSMFNTSLVR